MGEIRVNGWKKSLGSSLLKCFLPPIYSDFSHLLFISSTSSTIPPQKDHQILSKSRIRKIQYWKIQYPKIHFSNFQKLVLLLRQLSLTGLDGLRAPRNLPTPPSQQNKKINYKIWNLHNSDLWILDSHFPGSGWIRPGYVGKEVDMDDTESKRFFIE